MGGMSGNIRGSLLIDNIDNEVYSLADLNALTMEEKEELLNQ